jgi:predicted membrane protein
MTFQSTMARRVGNISFRLILGIVIIAMGSVFLADSMGLFDIERPGRFFPPAVFAAIGITLLVEKRTESSRYWAYGWLTAAAIEFAYQFYWIPFGIGKLIFPLVLLLIGARLVQRSVDSNKSGPVTIDGVATPVGENSANSAQNNDKNTSRVFAILSAQQVHKFTQPLTYAEVVSILSGVKVDLNSAVIEGDTATLHVVAVMGGIEIFAPSDWNVVSEITTIPGGFFDKRRPTTTIPTKTLRLRGAAILGGVEVKN